MAFIPVLRLFTIFSLLNEKVSCKKYFCSWLSGSKLFRHVKTKHNATGKYLRVHTPLHEIYVNWNYVYALHLGCILSFDSQTALSIFLLFCRQSENIKYVGRVSQNGNREHISRRSWQISAISTVIAKIVWTHLEMRPSIFRCFLSSDKILSREKVYKTR